MLNKVVLEGTPQAITFIFMLIALKLSQNDQWAEILALTALSAMLSALEFGRGQRIIAGSAQTTFTPLTFLILLVLFFIVTPFINPDMSFHYSIMLGACACIQIFITHQAAISSLHGDDKFYQKIMILLALARGVALIVTAYISYPFAYIPYLFLCLLIVLFVILFWRKKTKIKLLIDKSSANQKAETFYENAPMAIISLCGMVIYQLDRIFLYQYIDVQEVKIFSIISMLSTGALVLAPLKFRTLQSANESHLRLLDIFSILVFIVLLIVTLILSFVSRSMSVLSFGLVMIVFVGLNYYSQRPVMIDLKNNNHSARLLINFFILIFVIPLIVSGSYLNQYAIVLYWFVIVLGQLFYIFLKNRLGK